MAAHKNKFGNISFWFLFLFILLSSCKPPTAEEHQIPEDISGAFVVLNEGLFQNNNSCLTWYNPTTQNQSNALFEEKNHIALGDTGNDLLIHDEHIYVLMNNSHILHVLNRKSGKLIGQISFQEAGIGASPRKMVVVWEYLYVSAFNGYLYKIDLQNLEIAAQISLGANPENLLQVGSSLWVSNSGGLATQGDSTISVVDLGSFSELEKISVGRNPGTIISFDGSVYVVARGNYVDIPSKLVRISAETYEVINEANLEASFICILDNRLYVANYDYQNEVSSLVEINPFNLEEIGENRIQHLDIQTLYGVQELDVLGQKVVAFLDARQYVNQGRVVVTDLAFNELFSFSVGLNPTKIVFNAY